VSVPVESSVVVVTLKDVYLLLLELQKQVGAMQGSVGAVSDHESRIRSLEKWRYALPVSLAGATASIIVALYEGSHHG
jgi:hypothetical protein